MAKSPGPLKQAKQIVGAQTVSVDYAAKQSRQRAAKEQAALQASGQALVQLLQSGVAPAGQMYDAAVGQQQALAQGAAQLLAQANPNAQIQGDLAAIGAPPEQQALLQAQTQAQFPGQGAVLNIEEGAVPGASLIAQKAAEQGYLAGLPTVAALSGEQSLRGLLASAAKEQEGFQQQRLQIGGQLPALVSQLTEQAYSHQQDALDRAFQQRQFAYQQQKDALDRAAAQATTPYERAQLKLAYAQLEASQQGDMPTGLDVYKAETDRINAKRQRKEATTGGGASLQLKNNPDGSVSIFNPKTGKITQVKGPSGSTSTAGMTPTQTRAAKAKSHQLVAYIQEARTAGKPPTYDSAVEQALEQGIPLGIAVPMLNKIYPAQYKVTKHGLVQTGIRGQPSWTRPGTKKKKK